MLEDFRTKYLKSYNASDLRDMAWEDLESEIYLMLARHLPAHFFTRSAQKSTFATMMRALISGRQTPISADDVRAIAKMCRDCW